MICSPKQQTTFISVYIHFISNPCFREFAFGVIISTWFLQFFLPETTFIPVHCYPTIHLTYHGKIVLISHIAFDYRRQDCIALPQCIWLPIAKLCWYATLHLTTGGKIGLLSHNAFVFPWRYCVDMPHCTWLPEARLYCYPTMYLTSHGKTFADIPHCIWLPEARLCCYPTMHLTSFKWGYIAIPKCIWLHSYPTIYLTSKAWDCIAILRCIGLHCHPQMLSATIGLYCYYSVLEWLDLRLYCISQNAFECSRWEY